MMKKFNSGLLIVAALLLVVTIGLSSYAIYKTTAEGDATASVARWSVKVNDDDIVATETLTFDGDAITWNANAHVAADKIAPGKTGTITFEIDASQSEVSVDYEITIGSIKVGNDVIDNDAITAEVAGGDENGTIVYSTTPSEMVKTVTLNIEWDAIDSADQNTKDMTLAGQSITIPVTIVAKQHVA